MTIDHDHRLARQSLLHIVAGALAATAITWLGGWLFGPVADTRAHRLAAAMQPAPAASAAAVASLAGTTRGVPPPSGRPA